jgi:hypothetical protein
LEPDLAGSGCGIDEARAPAPVVTVCAESFERGIAAHRNGARGRGLVGD